MRKGIWCCDLVIRHRSYVIRKRRKSALAGADFLNVRLQRRRGGSAIRPPRADIGQQNRTTNKQRLYGLFCMESICVGMTRQRHPNPGRPKTFFFAGKFVYRLCRHMVYKFSDIRPGTGAPGDTALPVLVRPYDDTQKVRPQRRRGGSVIRPPRADIG